MPNNHPKSSFSLLLYIFYGLIGCATILFFILLTGGVLVFLKIEKYLETNQTRQSEYIIPENYQFPFDNKNLFDEYYFDDSFTQPFDNYSPSSDSPLVNLT